jgi:hypothetical protein
MVYKVHHARCGGVWHGARPGWLCFLRWLSNLIILIKLVIVLCFGVNDCLARWVFQRLRKGDFHDRVCEFGFKLKKLYSDIFEKIK